jgi:drug/metabolite transporter (DMT)-like permease
MVRIGMRMHSMGMVITVVTGIVAISTASIFIKLCDAHPLAIAAYRLGLASLLLSPVALSRKKYGKILRGRWNLLFLTGLFLGFHFIFWIASLKYTSVASSVVIVSTHPIFVALGSHLLLEERVTTLTIVGILLSITGAAIIGLSDFTLSTHAAMGDLLALGGAIMASAYLIVGRKLRQEMDLLSYIFPVYSAGALVVLIIGLAAGVSFFGYSSRTYTLFLMLAIVPQLIGHSTFNWALKFFSASTIAVLILGEPIGSTLLAYWILGETLSPWKAAGGICILAGIYAAMRGNMARGAMIISRKTG